jgi:hypothetical protein
MGGKTGFSGFWKSAVVDKEQFLRQLLTALQEQLGEAVRASKDAAEHATNEESRAESQWDTQGLEASYLAAGQAAQAQHIASAIDTLKGQWASLLAPHTQITPGSLFSCQLGIEVEWFFYGPCAGGQSVVCDDVEITVVSGQSPLIERALGRGVGELIFLPGGGAYEVLTVT